ncbi:NERD domain-containing protein [Aeromicrobium sp. YC3-14]|nr:NERD domain-containing protein [Aeromicrobium stalagmiti]
MLWPADPQFVNRTERKVWEALRDQLGPNDFLIAGQHFTTRERDYELDLIVVLDGGGVVVIEVKGGKVWNTGGHWWQQGSTGQHEIWPVRQAENGKYVLQDWVYDSPDWGSKGKVRWAHAVCFPDIEVELAFDTPDCHRGMVIDRHNMKDIVSPLRNLVGLQTNGHRACDGTDIAAIYDALSGRFLPQKNALLPVDQRVADHDEVADRLSEEQATILGAIQLLNRVEIRGGAGSGKTWLAVEQARRLSRAGQRVALLSYSRGLAAWMKRRVGTFEADEQPAYVGTFHGLGQVWGAPEGSDDDSDFWEVELPRLMVDLATGLPMPDQFDAIVIDESQDFADAWWPAIMASMKYEDSGLYVFSDEGQRIFSRFGDAPAGLVPLVLEQNLRNTRQISESFTTMAPNRLVPSVYDGDPVRFVPCSIEDAIATADDVVDQLLDEGWQPSDLALLTTQSRHQEHRNREEIVGKQGYWDSFWDADQVFYGTVLGFKGLERPAIVLAVNDTREMERARERLYVGLSRPRDLLVVCGDPAHIEAVGGADVLKRLRGGK